MEEKQSFPNSTQTAARPESTFVPPSEFDGRTIQFIGWQLLGVLLSVITLGIGAPWAHCMVIRWETKHTYVNGKRLYFDGKGHQLLGRYLLWGLLTVVTLGIFALFIPVRMHNWRASHTRFAKPNEGLTGPSGGRVFGTVLVCVIIVAVIVLLGAYLSKIISPQQPVSTLPTDDRQIISVITGEDGTWYYYADGSEYWVAAQTTPATVLEENQWYISSNGNQVPVRSGPHADYEIVGHLEHGDIINVEYMDDIWAYIGNDQWCSCVFLTKEPPAPVTKPTEEPTKEVTQPEPEEEGPSSVSGPIVGGWLMYASHPSDSWDIDAYEFRSDGTFLHEEGLYDYSKQGGWVYFLGGGEKSGWYTYKDGVLTLNYTMSNHSAITSEAPTWYESKSTVTKIVTFSADGKTLHFSDPNSGESRGDAVYMTGNIKQTLNHHYPNGIG